MTKLFCDRCNRDIQGVAYTIRLTHIAYPNTPEFHADLCDDCKKAVKQFVQEPYD